MTRWTVDCSTALKWFIAEANSDAASKWFSARFRHVVPDLFHVEVGNVLWKRHRRGDLTRSEAQRIYSELSALPVHVVSGMQLGEAALDLALAFNHSVYDCIYLAAAIASDAPLVTADRRFFELIVTSPLAAHIRWIEEVP